VEADKVVIMGDDPEKIAMKYRDRRVIIIYPKNKRPTAEVLLHKNFVRLFSDYSSYPDLESLEIIKDTILYLLNASYITSKDKLLLIFSKRGEEHKLFFDLSSMKLPTLLEMLQDRVDRKLVEKLVRLCIGIVKRGREGTPAGALFIVGDWKNVRKYILQKIANPMEGIEKGKRDIMDDKNIDTIREYALMDGATIIDDRGIVISSGAYVKNLEIGEWLMNGKGGRHLAAQSITKFTKAIGFVVSTEGVIRVYKDGKLIYELKDF